MYHKVVTYVIRISLEIRLHHKYEYISYYNVVPNNLYLIQFLGEFICKQVIDQTEVSKVFWKARYFEGKSGQESLPFCKKKC